MNNKEEVKAGCGAIIIGFLIMIGTFFLGTYVDQYMWNNILVPILNIPIIGYWQMFGVLFAVRFILWYKQGDSSFTKFEVEDKDSLIKSSKGILTAAISELVVTLLCWGGGFIIATFLI